MELMCVFDNFIKKKLLNECVTSVSENGTVKYGKQLM